MVGPICYVCDGRIFGRYYEDAHGNICGDCHRPESKCFTCGKQLARGKEMRLADFRVICPICYADASFTIEQKVIHGLELTLKKAGWYPCGKISFAVVDLPQLMIEKRNSNRTVMGTCNTDIWFRSSILISTEHRINVLFGLPRVSFFCSLTHELFHAWLNEMVDRYAFNPEETEWLCEHASYLLAITMGFDKFWQKKIRSSRDSYQVDSGFKTKYDVLSAREFATRVRQA